MRDESIKYNWQQKGLCQQKLKFDEVKKEFTHFSTLDFYVGTGKLVSSQVRKLCNNCPVKGQCLEHALKHEKYGFWGGMSEKQRRIVRKKRGIVYQAPQSDISQLNKELNPKEKEK